MATYTEIAALRRSQVLADKVVVALAKAASDVLSEDPTTTNHRSRVDWAMNALTQPEPSANRIFWAVLQNTNVQADGESISDANIQSAVNGLIDKLATA